MSRRAGRRARLLLGTLAPLLPIALAATTAAAQTPCGSSDGDDAPAPASRWPAPLDRVVSIQARDVSLRDALDHLAADSRVRLSYSAELLQAERRVCVVRSNAALGDVLVELLRGVAVQPTVVADDQVVLAPTTPAPQVARSVGVLDRVVVTGSNVAGGSARSLPFAVDVLRGSQLEQRNLGTLSELLDGSMPGVWIWSQSPSAVAARYGSVRGASSFGASYPKLYIDGVETANPLFVTELAPQSVERIEVIRGPQGAALYGADAISGVINVVTRHDGTQGGAPRAELRTGLGMTGSDYAARPALSQSHALTLRAGSGPRSATLGVTAASVGDYAPDASARTLSATGGFRAIGAHSTVMVTARLFDDRAGPAASPLRLSPSAGGSYDMRRDRAIGDGYPGPGGAPADGSDGQAVTAYTLGTTAIVQGDRWMHSLVLGLDGYRLSTSADDSPLPPAASDSVLLSARGAADRVSMRASSTLRVEGSGPASGSLTLGLEHSSLRERLVESGYAPLGSSGPGGDWPGVLPTSRSNSGAYAQTNVALFDALYLTGGLRVEHSTGTTGMGRYATLPMLGAALVRESGDLSVKLRAAYGKGIRTPRTVESLLAGRDVRGGWAAQATLAPEQQAGVEAGVDVTVGRLLSAQITRFDQIASGLVQAVVLAPSDAPYEGRDTRRPAYGLQNVGEIANRGWEMQATLGGPRLSLSGALSFVDSRVRRVADGYTGDLLPGDRMLEVPARTASLTTSWRSSLFDGSMTLARASDWINYDRLSLARASSGGEVTGLELRDFWRRYPGVTRLRATGSRLLRPGLALRLTGENLLGEQRGEPDDAVILPGRTVSAGIEVKF